MQVELIKKYRKFFSITVKIKVLFSGLYHLYLSIIDKIRYDTLEYRLLYEIYGIKSFSKFLYEKIRKNWKKHKHKYICGIEKVFEEIYCFLNGIIKKIIVNIDIIYIDIIYKTKNIFYKLKNKLETDRQNFQKIAKEEMDKGNFKRAIKYFNKIKIKEDNYWIYGDRGIAKMNIGDYKGAIKDFNKILELEPKEIFKEKREECLEKINKK